MFVSTHLISEFEGLIDQFTIIDAGRDVLTLDADSARERFQKVHARFLDAPAHVELPGAVLTRRGRELEILVDGNTPEVIERLRAHAPESVTTESLSLEEIFVSRLQSSGRRHDARADGLAGKEFRALLPLWCVYVARALAGRHGDTTCAGAARLAYVLGSFAIGAHAFGHSMRTERCRSCCRCRSRGIRPCRSSSWWPVCWSRCWLAPRRARARRTGQWPGDPAADRARRLAHRHAARSGLDAALPRHARRLDLRGSLLGCVALGGDIIGWIRFDTDAAAIQRFQVLFFWRAMPLLWIAAAVALWRSFIRAEATEGRGRRSTFREWLAPPRDERRSAHRRSPVWQVVAKELRLQQMVFAIAAIYLVIALLVVLSANGSALRRQDPAGRHRDVRRAAGVTGGGARRCRGTAAGHDPVAAAAANARDATVAHKGRRRVAVSAGLAVARPP